MERSDGDGSVPGIERLTLIGLVLAAVGLRLIGIGHLSFAGDEETTTLAAKALLEGWPPTLPGGLVYVRGLPFTALEALAVELLANDAEKGRLDFEIDERLFFLGCRDESHHSLRDVRRVFA